MEAIEKYLRSCHDVVRAPLTYILEETIAVQAYDDYPSYVTHDNEMIIRMSYLPTDNCRLLMENEASSVKVFTADYEIDNRTVYSIQILS